MHECICSGGRSQAHLISVSASTRATTQGLPSQFVKVYAYIDNFLAESLLKTSTHDVVSD